MKNFQCAKKLAFFTAMMLAGLACAWGIPRAQPTPTAPAATLTSDPCPGAFTPISQIQGSGAKSPLNGDVTTQGIVTADFQDDGQLGGFYIQSAAASEDGEDRTSEGIYIYDNKNPVETGERVQVTGRVREFQGQTELSPVKSVTVCGSDQAIEPVSIELPGADPNYLERFEGMLVTIPQALYVNQTYFLEALGQVSLSAANADGNLAYNPLNGNFPSSTAAENSRRMLVLDDSGTDENMDPIPYISRCSVEAQTVRTGDSVSGLTGILDYGPMNTDSRFRSYRIQPTQAVNFTYDPAARPAAPQKLPANTNVTVASFNVLNYFNGNGSGQDKGPGGFPTARGANNLNEFNRQRTKIIEALAAIDADIVGLMEIENDAEPGVRAVEDLVNGLNDKLGAGTYAVVDPPGTDPNIDQIKVAMIYKPGTVTLADEGLYYQTDSAAYKPLYDRPPQVQTFQVNSSSGKLTVVVNHFKSKSCSDAVGKDTDQGDGHGCYNPKRIAQAEAMLDLVADLAAVDPDVVVIGDLNGYTLEGGVQTLIDGGLVDLQQKLIPPAERYSFVFDGTLGTLDHALVTGSLAAQATGATIWHINAGEPRAIDYNIDYDDGSGRLARRGEDLYTPTPYRSSDHDPVILGFEIKGPAAKAPGLGSAPSIFDLLIAHGMMDDRFYLLTFSQKTGMMSLD